MAQDQSNRFAEWAVETVKQQAAEADLIVLWDLQEADHAEALLQGLCAVTFAEYRDRLRTVTAQLIAQGNKVTLVQAKPAQIERVIEEHQLPKDSSGVAAAIAHLFSSM